MVDDPAGEQAADEDTAETEPVKMTRAEMLAQLEAMASQVAGDAPPVARETAARAADLAATAARSTGPLAQRLAELTGDASIRFAERSERFAADLRTVEGEVVEVDASDSDDAPRSSDDAMAPSVEDEPDE